jgi:SAM-dependent methyltransferase
MLNLIERLPPGARVLDLGARSGSFRCERADISVVRLDLEIRESQRGGHYVSADAAHMPFAARSFDAVISNHSLEHFIELDATVREVGRVLRPDGGLYVAVPNAATLTDIIYRWLGKGGGHVNRFRAPEEVIRLVERLTGLRHNGTCALYSSLSFLNACNFESRPPRKILLFANGNERFLAAFVWVLRRIDRWFGTRLSQYGWSFYFGSADPPQHQEDWINVCVRCGSGHSGAFLTKAGAIAGLDRSVWYRCPACGGLNMFSPE